MQLYNFTKAAAVVATMVVMPLKKSLKQGTTDSTQVYWAGYHRTLLRKRFNYSKDTFFGNGSFNKANI